eukprot:6437762-Amphidinium_carterae.1
MALRLDLCNLPAGEGSRGAVFAHGVDGFLSCVRRWCMRSKRGCGKLCALWACALGSTGLLGLARLWCR